MTAHHRSLHLALVALAAALATMAPEGACQYYDALKPLSAARPSSFSLPANYLQVGLTTGGEGRARLGLYAQSMPGLGYRAYLSTDGGVTWPMRRPAGKLSNEFEWILIDGLSAATSYRVRLVGLSNIGITSEPVETWDHDNSSSTAQVPITIAVPPTRSDTVAPDPCTALRVEWQGDGVGLFWKGPDTRTDVFGYVVERAEPGAGDFLPVDDRVPDTKYPHLRDFGAASNHTYLYRVASVDLSGNRSAFTEPSDPLTVP